ncbi:MAG: helix-turn-helix domain-containing protein [Gemmatimonadales bacterium]
MNPSLLYDEDPERGERLAAILRDAGHVVRVVGPICSLEDAERRHISTVLEHTGGNRRQAAHLLGIARSTLLSKLRKYGLD